MFACLTGRGLDVTLVFSTFVEYAFVYWPSPFYGRRYAVPCLMPVTLLCLFYTALFCSWKAVLYLRYVSAALGTTVTICLISACHFCQCLWRWSVTEHIVCCDNIDVALRDRACRWRHNAWLLFYLFAVMFCPCLHNLWQRPTRRRSFRLFPYRDWRRVRTIYRDSMTTATTCWRRPFFWPGDNRRWLLFSWYRCGIYSTLLFDSISRCEYSI